LKPAFELRIEGAPTLWVAGFEAFERYQEGGRIHVNVRTASGRDSDLNAEALIGQKTTLELESADAKRGAARRFHGLVDSVETSRRGASIVVVPRLMLLADGADHRVFLEKGSVAIAESILRAHGLALETRVASPPKARAQCIQAFESDLDFVHRILAEDGISLWVEHTDVEDVVVLGQESSACLDLPGGARLRVADAAGLLGGEAVTDLDWVHQVTHDGVAVADYNPDEPTVDQSASVGGEMLQRFVYPAKHRTPTEGKARAQLYLERAQTEGVVLRARTTCRHVAVGFVVDLYDAPRRSKRALSHP
jgi:type VI secretion system secreted protein VgrG